MVFHFFEIIDSLLEQVDHLISYISTTHSINIKGNTIYKFISDYNNLININKKLKRNTRFLAFLSIILGMILLLIVIYNLFLVFFSESTSIGFLGVAAEIIGIIVAIFAIIGLDKYLNKLYPDYDEWERT
jgi:hypothetical protein